MQREYSRLAFRIARLILITIIKNNNIAELNILDLIRHNFPLCTLVLILNFYIFTLLLIYVCVNSTS